MLRPRWRPNLTVANALSLVSVPVKLLRDHITDLACQFMPTVSSKLEHEGHVQFEDLPDDLQHMVNEYDRFLYHLGGDSISRQIASLLFLTYLRDFSERLQDLESKLDDVEWEVDEFLRS